MQIVLVVSNMAVSRCIHPDHVLFRGVWKYAFAWNEIPTLEMITGSKLSGRPYLSTITHSINSYYAWCILNAVAGNAWFSGLKAVIRCFESRHTSATNVFYQILCNEGANRTLLIRALLSEKYLNEDELVQAIINAAEMLNVPCLRELIGHTVVSDFDLELWSSGCEQIVSAVREGATGAPWKAWLALWEKRGGPFGSAIDEIHHEIKRRWANKRLLALVNEPYPHIEMYLEWGADDFPGAICVAQKLGRADLVDWIKDLRQCFLDCDNIPEKYKKFVV